MTFSHPSLIRRNKTHTYNALILIQDARKRTLHKCQMPGHKGDGLAEVLTQLVPLEFYQQRQRQAAAVASEVTTMQRMSH